MDLKLTRRAAILAAPSVAGEHLSGETAVGVGFKAQSRPLRFESVQGCSLSSRAIATAARREECRGVGGAPRTTYPRRLVRGLLPPKNPRRSSPGNSLVICR